MEINGGQLIGLIAVVSVLTIPALAIGARLALRPIVDALAHLKDLGTGAPPSAPPDRRIVELEGQVRELQQEVQRLSEAAEFYQQLRGEKEPARVAAASGTSCPSAGAAP